MGNRFDALQEQMDKRLSAIGNDLQELAKRMDAAWCGLAPPRWLVGVG